jgi:uncharacterized protein YceH (UPF0502 family)
MPQFDLQPKNKRKISLFANKAEAIVFWLCIAGLIFLGIVSFFRYLGAAATEADKKFRRETQIRIRQLEEENSRLEARLDSLEAQLRVDAE